MQGAKTNETWIINLKHQNSNLNYDGKDIQKIVSISVSNFVLLINNTVQ